MHNPLNLLAVYDTQLAQTKENCNPDWDHFREFVLNVMIEKGKSVGVTGTGLGFVSIKK